jgi:hypothetical protein
MWPVWFHAVGSPLMWKFFSVKLESYGYYVVLPSETHHRRSRWLMLMK